MKNYPIILLGCMLLLCSCGTETEGSESSSNEVFDPHQAAIPDSDTQLEVELSDEDKKKLAEAVGKEAEDISLQSLNAILSSMDGKTALCLFADFGNSDIQQVLSNLGELSKNTDPAKLSILMIHRDSIVDKNSIDALVREKGIDADTYIMSDEADLTGLQGNGDATAMALPAYYIYSSDGTAMWIDGSREYAELYVMLQPFIL